MENDTLYSYKLRKGNCTLQRIRNIQGAEILSLPSEERDALHEALERGTDIISSEIQMCMYMYSYGKMHIAKMYDALDHVDKKIFGYKDIAIVDYGCGQGIGTLALIEYLKNNNIDVENIKSVTLIEPSKVCLDRAELHVSLALPDSEVKVINKQINDIFIDELKNKHYYTIHLFSNILDVESVDIAYLAKLLRRNRFLFEEIICVGPCFADYSKQQRYDLFGENLGIKPHYSQDFEKGGWKENWTYSVRLYSNNTLRGLKVYTSQVDGLDLVYKEFSKVGVFSETSWCWYDDKILKGSKYISDLSDDIRLKVSFGDEWWEDKFVNRTQKECGETFNILNIKLYLKKQEHVQSVVDEIIECYRSAAKDGIYEAYNNLGVYLLQKNEDCVGEEYEAIREDALSFFVKAAEHGSENAILNILWLYNQYKSPEEVKRAIKKYQKANSFIAHLTAAYIYQFGKLETEEDLEMAEQTYLKAIEILKDKDSKSNASLDDYDIFVIATFYNLAQIYYEQSQYEKAYELIKEIANETPNFAVKNFGIILEAKLFGKPIINQLLKLYDTSKNCIVACNIARCYIDGIGVKKNFSLAEEYVEASLEHKDWDGNYSYPKAVPLKAEVKVLQENKEEAVKLWETAKSILPENECGYSLNQDVAINDTITYELASKYLQNGCLHCHEAVNYDEKKRICPRCEHYIAFRLIEQGKNDEALDYLVRAAYQGYMPARRSLFGDERFWSLLDKSKKVKDETLIDWFTSSCNEKSIIGAMNAAILYLRNNDKNRSLYWAAIAANSAKEYAVEYMLKLYSLGLFPANLNDITFWGKVLAKQKNESLYKVLGDSFASAGRKEAAESMYKLEKK